MIECHSCSAAVREEMKFCPSCGTQLAGKDLASAILQQDGPATNEASVEDLARSVPSSIEQDTERVKDSVPDLSNSSVTRNQKIAIAVASVLALIGVLIFQGFSIANENAEEVRQAQRAEIVASACAQIVGDHVTDLQDAEVVRHQASDNTVVVNFLNANSAHIGSDAKCVYSVSDTTLSIESIEWGRKIDGRATDITYDRASGLIRFAKEPLAPTPATTDNKANGSCEQAFRAAAAVPLSQDNNDEIRETTRACNGVDEWWEMLKKYPDVFGVTYLLDSEKGLYVGSACLVGQGYPVCREADLLGIGF